MKAEITQDGVIIVVAESHTEAYAMKEWYAKSEGYKVALLQDENSCDLIVMNSDEQIAEFEREQEQREGVEE